MDSAQWQRAKELLADALEQPVAERVAFLQARCSDAELLAEMQKLLAESGPGAGPIELASQTLDAGFRIGSYVVVHLLGRGGMGEVYRAHDTKLGRAVALKVLPAAAGSLPESLLRLRREAQVLATLSHPNIGAIYGLEDAGNVHAIVLELVDGPTLAERLARGALPLTEALPIARQIAEALESAHAQGVFHRDLKPTNIKLTGDGSVKVLDFGIAKVMRQTQTEVSFPTVRGWLSQEGTTKAGTILGTAAYASPEQAKGIEADKRSDIWALGCVLYEMLTGVRAFQGRTTTETLASVQSNEPDWSRIPGNTPGAIVRVLQRCLVKDRKGRVPDAAIVRFEIDDVLASPTIAERSARSHRRPGRFWAPRMVGGMFAGVLVALLPLFVGSLRDRPPVGVTRFGVQLPPGVGIVPQLAATQQVLAIARDGRRVVFNGAVDGVSRIYVRPLNQLEATPIAGIEGTLTSVFLSPDGEWVGFVDAASQTLKKIRVAGGSAVMVCRLPNAVLRGATWGINGTIVFATQGTDRGLMQVSDAGGSANPLTHPVNGQTHTDPHFLPDGRTLLYSVGGRTDRARHIAALSIETGRHQDLLEGSQPRFTSSGHLVFQRQGAIWTAAFDPVRLQLSGAATRVVDEVTRAFDVATNTGSLVYFPGASPQGRRTLVWTDRRGNEDSLGTPPRGYTTPRLSPDATTVAVAMNGSIWRWDVLHRTLSRFVFETSAEPVWTPDGKRVLFRISRDGADHLYWQAADGTGGTERLTGQPGAEIPYSFSPDGTRLVFRVNGARTANDLQLLTVADPARSEPLLQSQADEQAGEISPDGRWLAYQSSESGRDEVYVRPFPRVSDGRWLVSSAGGARPAWARSGNELYYVSLDGGMMAAPIDTRAGFRAGTPVRLFEGRSRFWMGAGGSPRPYDVSPDGRFLLIKEGAANDEAGSFAVVENWSEELKALTQRR